MPEVADLANTSISTAGAPSSGPVIPETGTRTQAVSDSRVASDHSIELPKNTTLQCVVFGSLCLIVGATYLFSRNLDSSNADFAVFISAASTAASFTFAVWFWWREFAGGFQKLSHAVVTPWLCVFVGLTLLCASHLWLSASGAVQFLALNPLTSVPAVIFLLFVFRELVDRVSTGFKMPAWEERLLSSALTPNSSGNPPQPTGSAFQLPGNNAQFSGSAAQVSGNAAQFSGNAAQFSGNAAQFSGNAAQAAPFVLKAGSPVTCDARILKGSVVVRERWLSPLAELRVRDEQDILFAGSVIVVGEAEILPLLSPSDSVLSRLSRAAYAVMPAKSASVEDSVWSNVACFACLCVAAGTGIFWNERGASAVTSATLASSVLFTTASILVWQAVREMSHGLTGLFWRAGVLIKSHKVIEKISRALRVAVVHRGVDDLIGVRRVASLEVLDDRYDREALAGVLLALSGRAEDPWHRAICGYIVASRLPISLLRAADYREYDGKGVCASIQGVDFTLGTEGFLLDRGVQLQNADTCQPEEVVDDVFYLAIQRYVVMRIALRCDENEELERLRRFAGDQISSAEITEKPLSTRELTPNIKSISGDPQTLQAALINETPDLTILLKGTQSLLSSGLNSAEGLTAQRFDGSSLEIPKSDIVLFSEDTEALGRVRVACNEMVRWEAQQKGIVFGVGAATIAAALVGLGSPVIAIVLACFASLLSLKTQRRIVL